MFVVIVAISAGVSIGALITGHWDIVAAFGVVAALFAFEHRYRSTPVRRAAETELREAQAALDNLDCGHDYECPEYLAANRRVIDAEQAVSWWRRPFVRLGVL